MARLILLAVGAAILYYLIRNELRRRSTGAAGEPGKESATMCKDPICGTFVGEDSISIRDGETVHRFCSYECRDAFLDQLRNAGRAIPEKKPDSEQE